MNPSSQLHMARTAPNNLQPEPASERTALNPAQRLQKKRLIRLVILICLVLLFLLAWFEKNLLSSHNTLSIESNILLFGIINLNVLLALLMFFLVLRNLAELIFESRQKLLGFKLKTKLVTSFICLSLIPSALLFFVALQFISTSMDYWFNTNIERSLQESLELAQSVLQEQKDQAKKESQMIEQLLARQQLNLHDPEAIYNTLTDIISSHLAEGPDSLLLITEEQHLEVMAPWLPINEITLPRIPLSTLQEARRQNERVIIIQESAHGDLIRCIAQIAIPLCNPVSISSVIPLLIRPNRSRWVFEVVMIISEKWTSLIWLSLAYMVWGRIVMVKMTKNKNILCGMSDKK